jgi:hypothetical protein
MSSQTIPRTFFGIIRLSSIRLIITLSIVAAGLTASALAWLSPSINNKTGAPEVSAKTDAPTSPGDNSAQERVEVERIMISPRGFEPAEIRRPQGPFILAVNNQTGVNEVTLRLEKEAGNKLREVSMPKGKRYSNNTLDLQPGRYTLTEANHPDWAAQIIITAR